MPTLTPYASAPLLAILLMCCGIALASSPREAGRLIYTHGSVTLIDPQTRSRQATTGTIVFEGDQIRTGQNSIAQLRLSDGAMASLRSHSQYQIEQQHFDESLGIYQQTSRLMVGWMRSITGTIGARQPASVLHNTPVATIGIRGTVYQTIHIPENGLPGFPGLPVGTYLFLEEGAVLISNAAGSLLLQPGQIASVGAMDQPPRLRDDLTGLFSSDPLSPPGESRRQAPTDTHWIDEVRRHFNEPEDTRQERVLEDFKGDTFEREPTTP
jgi:hypothetical protein